MSQELKERVSTLESTLQDFIRHTDRSFIKVNNAIVDLQTEMSDFKEEMREFKSEMGEFKDEMKGFKGEMARKWGELANRLGTLAEDIVAPKLVPAAHKYFNCQGEPLDFMPRRVRAHSKDKGRSREFDAIAVFEDTILLSETKSTPRSEYVRDFAQVITEFFDYFPEHAGKKLIPIFASLNIAENIIKQATKNKIFAMALRGDTMEILNYHEVSGGK
jgi:hypothetical protein